MKQFYIILSFVLLISCNSIEKTNGYGERDRTCRKYENDITFVHNRFNPIVKVLGKWRALPMSSALYLESKSTVAIGNSYNEVLQITLGKCSVCKLCQENKHGQCIEHDPFLSLLKNKINHWKNYEGNTVELLETDENSYAVYHLSNEKEKKTILFGFKNNIFYDFNLLNSSKEKLAQAQVLSKSFKIN